MGEMVVLTRHRPKPAHLPEQPLEDLDASAQMRGNEPAGLLRQVQQDCTRLEDRDGIAPRLRRVIDQRMRLFGEMRRKAGSNCSPLPIFTGLMV